MYLWLHGQPAPDDFKARFRRLLAESFDLVFSAHGRPVPFADDPSSAIGRLLDTGRFAAPAMGTGLAPAAP
jgi:hypothetical protein